MVKSFAAMVVPNSVVTIKADANSMLDYFLVFVTSFGVIELDEQETSDFGHMYPRGSKVIKGHYLEYKKSTRKDLIFTRDSKAAIIPYASLIYCAIDLRPGKELNQYLLSNEDHAEILCTISM